MNRIPEVKAAIKNLIGQGIDQAIRRLEEILSPASPLFNTYIQLKSRYSAYLSAVMLGTVSQKELDEQYAKLSHTLILLTDGIQDSDLNPETNTVPSANTSRRGELLYHIPRQMQKKCEYRCTVRLAYLKDLLYEDWKNHHKDIQKSIRIAEVMSVELINLDEKEPFSIRSLHNSVQFLAENDFTEWLFFVRPKKIGEFSLALRISIIEVRDGREVKKDIVLEQRVIVVTESAEQEDTLGFVSSGIEMAFIPSIYGESPETPPYPNNHHSKNHIFSSLVLALFSGILVFSFIASFEYYRYHHNVILDKNSEIAKSEDTSIPTPDKVGVKEYEVQTRPYLVFLKKTNYIAFRGLQKIYPQLGIEAFLDKDGRYWVCIFAMSSKELDELVALLRYREDDLNEHGLNLVFYKTSDLCSGQIIREKGSDIWFCQE